MAFNQHDSSDCIFSSSNTKFRLLRLIFSKTKKKFSKLKKKHIFSLDFKISSFMLSAKYYYTQYVVVCCIWRPRYCDWDRHLLGFGRTVVEIAVPKCVVEV